MAINFDDYECQFCGKRSTNYVFAAFVCDDPECIEKARIERGGPGGAGLAAAGAGGAERAAAGPGA